MKKILRKILAVSASLLLLSSFVSCGEGEDDDDKSGPVVPGGSTGGGGASGDGTALWKNAEMLTDFANTEYKWAELKIDSEIASRLQVGSKVIFELEENAGLTKFRITRGWTKIGNGKIGDPNSTTPYYKLDGTKIKANEMTDNPETWENDASEPGTYYFVVDAANLEALHGGFDIVGCFKCVKIGITNLAAPVQPEEIADFATDAIGDVVTFNVSKAALTKDHNKITLRYLRSAKSAKEKITLKDAVYYVQCNNGKIEKKTGDIKFALNPYGGCFDFGEDYKEGTPVTDAMRTASGKYTGNSLNEPEVDANEYNFEIAYNPKQFAVGDVVKFQLVSAKVTGEGAAKINDIKKKIKAILVDGSENAGKESGVSPTGWYEELTAQLADVVYPRVIKDSAVIETVDAPVVDAGLLEEPVSFVKWNSASVSKDKFEGLAISDKLLFTYVTNDEKDAGGNVYHNLQVIWDSDDNKKEFGGLSATTTDATVEFLVDSEEKVTKITTSGIKLQGHGVDLKKLEIVKGDGTLPEPEVVPTAVEVGEECLAKPYSVAWNDKGLIESVVFTKAGKGSVLTIKYVGDGDTSKADYKVALKFIAKSWAARYGLGEFTGAKNDNATDSTDDDSYMRITPTTKPTDTTTKYTITYAPTDTEWASIKSKGFAIAGEGAKITSVKFSAPTEAESGESGGSGSVTPSKTIEIKPNVYTDDGATEATNHGLQYLIEGNDLSTFFEGGLPKSGETYTVKIVGTADAEFDGMMQFMNGWTGISGEAVSAKFTTTEFTIESDFTFSADLSSTEGKFQLFNKDTNSTKKTLTVKEFTFAKKGSSSGDDTSSTGATVTEIFSEEVVLTGWSNGKVIGADKFASAKAGDKVRFVAEADDTPDGEGSVYHSFKVAANKDWGTAFNQFDGVTSAVEYTLTAENITAINDAKEPGLAFYGHGVKIIRVELVAE